MAVSTSKHSGGACPNKFKPQPTSEFSVGHPPGQVPVQPVGWPIKLEPQDNSEFSVGHPPGQVPVQPVYQPPMPELRGDLSEFFMDKTSQKVCKHVPFTLKT